MEESGQRLEITGKGREGKGREGRGEQSCTLKGGVGISRYVTEMVEFFFLVYY